MAHAVHQTETMKFLVDGRWLDAGEPIEIRSPAGSHVVGITYRAGPAHVEAAIAAAVRAFAETRRMPACQREAVLRRIASSVEQHREDLARLVALEAG